MKSNNLSSMRRKMFTSYCFVVILSIVSLKTDSLGDSSDQQSQKLNIGVVVDLNSREGREEKVAMQLAIEDFYANASNRPTLRVKNSHGDPIRAVSSVKTLIKKHHVSSILGFGTWQEAALVAELSDKSKVPTLSLANEVPLWSFQHWPFLIIAARSQFAQMKAVAAIIQSWQWRKVNVIYEDINSAVTGMIPFLISALQDAGSEINDLLPLSPMPSFSISGKLKHLKSGQSRVFVVHTTNKLAANIFTEAKNLGMMEKEFVWITTTDITNLIDTYDTSVISSMQGVLGVRSYYYHSTKLFKDFRSRFRNKFHMQYKHDPYPEPEPEPEPGIYALQAYDAMCAVALAMEGFSHRKGLQNSTDSSRVASVRGQKLLSRIKESNFEGLAGAFIFRKGMLAPAHIFQIINVVGKSYRELGYWTEELGFSESTGIGGKYNKSMRILGQVFWPGGPWSVPRGWEPPTIAKPLKIGVPMGNQHKVFIQVKHDNHKGELTITGFSIDVFRSTLSFLPYALPHDFVPFNGTYDSLVEQIKLQTVDAVVADTAIVANRCRFAEFSQPYADPGLQMLVYVKPQRLNKAWLFTKPLTASMWFFTGLINIYNGIVVWLIERKYNRQLVEGTIWEQIGRMLSTAFITLFSLKGDKLHSNLSRMAMVAWLFVALVITQSFTANLTTLLTVQRLDPVLVDVGTLKESRAKVGCDGNSFVVKYLEHVLGFEHENIVRIYSEDQYAQALVNGEIAAAFLEVPYVKVFLAKNCRRFATSGPTFKVGGFGFVFPRNSPYLPDISEAILKVAESGKLKDLETSLTSSYKCLASESDDHDSLGLSSYWGLFVITGGTSTISLLLFGVGYIRQNWNQQINPAPDHEDGLPDRPQPQPDPVEDENHFPNRLQDPVADEPYLPDSQQLQLDPVAHEHHSPDRRQDPVADEHHLINRQQQQD